MKNENAGRYSLEKVYVGLVHLVFDGGPDKGLLAGDSAERDHNMRANVLMDSFRTGLSGIL